MRVQQSFLDDPSFYPEMEKKVIKEKYSAEYAVNKIVEQFVIVFEGMKNEYMRQRAADIKDLGNRLLAGIRGKKELQLSDVKEEVVLVADDLTPSDTVQLDKNFILGFITRIGGKTSHTAILARSLDIPAIVGIGQEIENINNGDFLIIDGSSGICLVNPHTATIDEYKARLNREQTERDMLAGYIFEPAVTQDGHRIEIAANIGAISEAKVALEKGAESIGLYRTEFLFLNEREMPDEGKQFQAYKEVAETFGPKPVIVRTLDIGGDKELPYLPLPKEMNPFLGYRAVRIGLDRKEILVAQLRAILRASVYGNFKIMFPMISSLEEWRQVKSIYQEVRDMLNGEGLAFDEKIEIGIMVEIPSAAILAEQFANEVDFFSIGTNDLVQYTLAVDRLNEKVAYLYDYFHPAVLQLIKRVIDAAHEKGKWVGMCGGMAGDPLAAPLLVGMGLDEWSMSSGSIKKMKYIISTIKYKECRELVKEILSLDTTTGIRQRLEEFRGQA